MDGGVAQLGEHLPCKQGVMGSIPIISTIFKAEAQSASGLKIELMRKRSHRRKHVFCRIRRRYKREAVPVERIWVQIPITGQSPDPTVGGCEYHAVLRTPRIPFWRKPGGRRAKR